MSGKLEECTRKAFLMALGGVMKAWGDKMIAVEGDLEGCRATHDGASRLILPFRPLILGGDDVTDSLPRQLCHAFCAGYDPGVPPSQPRSRGSGGRPIAVAGHEW